MALAAIVMAAGASTRMGAPKALLVWRGQMFVTHAIALASGAKVSPIVVVEGADRLPDDAIADAVRVVNEAWRDGPLGSLQTGLRALLDAGPSGVLVLTVDRPHVRPRTIESLVQGHAREPAAVWQPSHGSKHGHPVLWPAALIPELLALGRDRTPRDLLERDDVAPRRRYVEVTDAAVLDNIDTPEDLAHLDSTAT